MDPKHQYRRHQRVPADFWSWGGYRHCNARDALAVATKGVRQ